MQKENNDDSPKTTSQTSANNDDNDNNNNDSGPAPLRRSRSFFSEVVSDDPSSISQLLQILPEIDGGPIVLASEPEDELREKDNFENISINPSECFPSLEEVVRNKDETVGELALMIQGVYKRYRSCASVSGGYVLNGLDLKKCYLHHM